MTAAYSMDLRQRAMTRKAKGETNRQIAAALGIAPSCVSKWTKRRVETGSLAPAKIGGSKPRTLSGETAQWLRERLKAGPFTLRACRRSWPSVGSRPIRRRYGCSSMPRI